jgi:ParB family chromosome partitioning protein
VPVVVRDEADPQHQAELRLVENVQRRDLDPMELARAYQALIAEHGLTHEDLAGRVNKERPSISNALRLLTLPEDVQRLVAAGELSAGHARALLASSDPERIRDLARRTISEGLSVRAIEKLAKTAAAPAAAPARRDPNLIELEDNLRHLFGSRVHIVEKGGKGSITVDFASKDHYQRVVTLLERFIRQANLDKVGTAPSRT